MDTLRVHVAVALRRLRYRPLFAAVAIVTIALGIGSATAIYSVVDGVLLRPLAFRDADEILALWQTYPAWRKDPSLAKEWDRNSLSIPEYRDLSAATSAFSKVAIWAARRATLGSPQALERVTVVRASWSLLPLLGVAPAIGRNFTLDEDRVGGAPVALISHEFWRTRSGGDPGMLGTIVRLDDVAYTVIGVLPPTLSLFRGGRNAEPPVWIPAGRDVWDATRRDNHSYLALARLAPGVTSVHARDEAARILTAGEQPGTRGVRLEQWQADQARDVRGPLLLLFSATGVLLAIGCVNVAILLLGEATAREKEIAARIAIGATSRGIFAQLLTEGIVLAMVAAVAGTGLAWAGTRVLIALAPSSIPGLDTVAIDGRVLAFALAVSTLTGVLFGLAPALTLARSQPAQLIRGAEGGSVRGHGTLQQTMIAVELALSLVLLVGSALLGRSLNKLTSVDPGFRAAGLLNVRVALSRSLATDSFATREAYRAVVERLRALPGVASASAGQSPFGGSAGSTDVDIPANPGDAPRNCSSMASVLARTCPTVRHVSVMPGFLETLGVPLLSGRALTDADRTGGQRVILVSESMAKRLFRGESPLNKRVHVRGAWREIVGVVGDTKVDNLSEDVQPTLYTPTTQHWQTDLQLLVRGTADPSTLVRQVRDALGQAAPGVVFVNADAMPRLIRQSSANERYRTMLISVFGVVAALLAAGGMFGVTARAVSRRSRELGIRIALGASAPSVTRLVLRHTFVGAGAGIVVGVIVSMLTARGLTPFLFGVTATDRVSYAVSIGLLVTVAIVASWLPARRAARLQPGETLRQE